jgi:hypothetical protein
MTGAHPVPARTPARSPQFPQAIGIDTTEPMAERARGAARPLGFRHVEVRAGDALDLPLDPERVEFVIWKSAASDPFASPSTSIHSAAPRKSASPASTASEA